MGPALPGPQVTERANWQPDCRPVTDRARAQLEPLLFLWVMLKMVA